MSAEEHPTSAASAGADFYLWTLSLRPSDSVGRLPS
jgi:hypothetical protein